MRINGFGDLNGAKKITQKDVNRKAPSPEASAGRGAAPEKGDAVQISPEARLLGKIGQIPEVRQEEVERVLAKIQNGTLITPDALKDGIHNLLGAM